jgi:opacity protein-like surface antigen
MAHRSFRKTLAVAVVSAAFVVSAGTAQAQQPASAHEWGSYLAAGVGEPEFGELGLKIFGGQQFHPNLAGEVGFMHFIDDSTPTPFRDVKTEFWGLSAAAVGILPLQPGLSAFGKLGVIYGRARIRTPTGTRRDSEFNPLIGIGVQYQLTPRVGVRVEFEEFDQGNLLSAGAAFRF